MPRLDAVRSVVLRIVAGCKRAACWIADAIGCHRTTLARWQRSGDRRRGPGRPRKPASLDLCFKVCAKIEAVAGRIDLRALHKLFPEVSRARLEDMLQRNARCRAERRRQHRAILEWRRAGTVWAMDFTALDGRVGPVAMSVRDLASRKDLRTVKVAGETSATAVEVLRTLFEEHGAPLVLKCDNGSAFRARQTRDLLDEYGVVPLYSPPWTPSYNGSCESGLGVVKRVATDLCALRDPGGSMADHLQDAVEVLGERPVHRRTGPLTRNEVWAGRRRVTSRLRRRFRRCHEKHLRAQLELDGIATDAELTHDQRASLGRRAIRDALCDLNLLTIQRP